MPPDIVLVCEEGVGTVDIKFNLGLSRGGGEWIKLLVGAGFAGEPIKTDVDGSSQSDKPSFPVSGICRSAESGKVLVPAPLGTRKGTSDGAGRLPVSLCTGALSDFGIVTECTVALRARQRDGTDTDERRESGPFDADRMEGGGSSLMLKDLRGISVGP